MTTRKRPHEEENRLGAGEFATILNGDDARLILTALKSFTKTIRRERRQALQIDDGGDEDSDEDEDQNSVGVSNKKLKEEWMQDSKDYNVPFVGTSIAKGETGIVVVGEWPTGFLQAYLRKSPLAVELTSDDLIPPAGHIHKRLLKQKLGKMSYAIHKAYLKALAELITAAVPISALERQYGVNNTSNNDTSEKLSEPPKFMTVFMKDRFPGIIQLLNEETSSGRGKTGSISGIGQLAIPALQILRQLASSSLATSRQVVRALDGSVREGVIKVLLREPRKPKEKTDGAEDDDDEVNAHDRLVIPYETRSSCLDLAVALLQMNDQSITSYISTLGSKEKKNNPGILFLAVRHGLQDSIYDNHTEITNAQEDYLDSVSMLLQEIKMLLDKEKEGLVSRRHLADLLGAEALQNLTRIAECAPQLRSFEAVLRGEDEYEQDLSSLENVGVDARRLLFPLLGSTQKSAFIWRVTGKEDDKLSNIYTTFIVKALNELLKTSSSAYLQRFVVHCLCESPFLMPAFFRGVFIPDLKATFAFLSKLRFMAQIITDGPSPSLCIATAEWNPKGTDRMLLSVLPQSLSKSLMNRALQSSNPLVVTEAAKLIILMIARFEALLSTIDHLDSRDMLMRAMVMRLPDVQILLASRSKFNPFSDPNKANVIVNGIMCHLIIALSTTLPASIITAKFDWINLLPDDIPSFCKAQPLAQIQTLQALKATLYCKAMNKNDLTKPSTRACCTLLEIAMTATHYAIYTHARSIAKTLLLSFLDCHASHSEHAFSTQYEISMWLDGMTKEMLPEFQAILDDAAKNAFRHKLMLVKAWKAAQLPMAIPEFPFSIILSIALFKIEEISDGCSRFVYQIASRCLLFASNPLPLATVLQYRSTGHKSNILKQVIDVYSKSVIDICKEPLVLAKSELPSQQAKNLYSALFGKASTHSDSVLCLRYCLQYSALLQFEGENNPGQIQYVQKILQDGVVALMQRGQIDDILMSLKHSAVTCGSVCKRSNALLELFALSHPESTSHLKERDFVTSSVLSCLKAPVFEVTTEMLFTLLKVWTLNHFIAIPQFSEIGSIMIAKVSSSSTKKHPFLEDLALQWIYQENALSTSVAWEAWKAYTNRLESGDQNGYRMIHALDARLQYLDGKEASLLYVRIHQLGVEDFVKRCLLSMTRTDENSAFIGGSLLLKSIEIGCENVGTLLLALKACQRNKKKNFMTRYNIKPDIFEDNWTSAALEKALVNARMIGSQEDEKRQDNQLTAFLEGVPKALKEAFRATFDNEESASTCMNLLRQVVCNLEDTLSFTSIDSITGIDAVVKACLKFGISDVQGTLAMVSALSLKLVRVLLSFAWHPQNAVMTLRTSSTLLDPHLIWSMVLSHSKFVDAITGTEEKGGDERSTARENLVGLLVCCISLTTKKVGIEEKSLLTLVSSYNGGTTETDMSLRRLLYLIETHIPPEKFPYVEDIGRLVLSKSLGVETNERAVWNFLHGSLDLRRVRETLAQFPRCSSLLVLPLDFESWVKMDEERGTSMTEEIHDDEESFSDSSESLKSESSEDGRENEKSIDDTPTSDLWRGRGPDYRYDPSFIIPQIWAAMEAHATADQTTESSEQSGEFVRLTQSLCEKGGLALCLASLCSTCSLVRKLAFSSLCLFMLAVDSEAGKDLSTWRERPQLKMLLNAVQYGFLLRKAMLIGKGLGSEIPKLPSVSAIFLAKASLILEKPADVMYSAINKYFLKLEKGHGAFNDMTRLPAFIPLFCSSSEESPERERSWSLQCLRDSFLEGYNMVASCHAPELLLTTLGRTHLDDYERQLILQVLTRFLQFGGKPATHHLLGRVGLLSWLRAFIMSTPLEDKSFLYELLKVAVNQGVKYTGDDQRYQLTLDLRNLLAPLSTIDGGSHSFCLVVDRLFELGYCEVFSSAGVSIAATMNLLRSSSSKSRMLEAICKVPLNLKDDMDDHAVSDYCANLVREVLALPHVDVSIVLRRVCCLARYASPELLPLVLETHKRAVYTDAYRPCLEALLESQSENNENDEWISVARDIVTFLPQDEAKQPKK